MIPTFGDRHPERSYKRRPGSYVLLTDRQGHIAVVHTPAGAFLPGGGMESGETAEQAAVREAREETGLDVRIVGQVGHANEYVHAVAESAYFLKIGVFFYGEVVGRGEGSEPDHQLAWVALADAEVMLTHGSHRWAVTHAAARSAIPRE